jgi:hypothetical protein
MTKRIASTLINYLRIKRLTGILLLLLAELNLVGQETKVGQALTVSQINIGVPYGIRQTETQIILKKVDVRVFRIKPEDINNFEEYEIYPIQFIKQESGHFDSLILANMQIKINNSPVHKNKKAEALQNLKISGLISPIISGSMSYSAETSVSPYGLTFLLHDGSATLSSLKTITKDRNGQLGGICEYTVNENDTIVFSKLTKSPYVNRLAKVELTVAGPGAKIVIADGSIIDVDGLYNKVIIPDDKINMVIDQKKINVMFDGSMMFVTTKTQYYIFQSQFKWSIQKINGKSIGKLDLIKKEEIVI